MLYYAQLVKTNQQFNSSFNPLFFHVYWLV